jgi:hypothetical protein
MPVSFIDVPHGIQADAILVKRISDAIREAYRLPKERMSAFPVAPWSRPARIGESHGA